MRLSFLEGLCLVAIGVAMVELQGGQRAGRPEMNAGTALATAAKPAAAAGSVRLHEAMSLTQKEGYR